ncbi:pilus assembly protein [Burkholderia metallica]|uniref:TadE family protein n=1 Tax=Burkholderia metallica TaxID=488729 RepID=UPI00157B5E60|nr:TadE family protein [Burkholderia metallica]NTZ88889.1 pilus assembly protein [Burkholderia metallica]
MSVRKSLRMKKMCGQSATEFLIVFPVLLFFSGAIVQLAFIFQAQATLENAALQAARRGAVYHGAMQEIRKGLADGLAPLFSHQASESGRTRAISLALAEIQDGGVTDLRRLNPTRAAFEDFARSNYAPGKTVREIPNDTLMYRDTRPGLRSGMNIQDANQLKIHVTYCYRMFVPVMDRIFYSMVNGVRDWFGTGRYGGSSAPTRANLCTIAGQREEWRIPLDAEAIVRMQTPFRLDE